ncbi:hypothetical protein [Embleya sp. NPDC005971]|uniref:hypothetical protein n=1 Tax=Embleya sp. NPDC005971 TaxID=3156724 RepID=UPI0033D60DD7
MTAPGIMPSWPRILFSVAFAQGGATPATGNATGWIDLSSRLTGQWSADQSGRQYELDQVQSGSLSLTLSNTDGALDPSNTGSPLYPNVLPLRPCRLQAVWPPSRNLAPAVPAGGTSTPAYGTSIRYTPGTGTIAAVTGLAADPTGRTNAIGWTIAASTASGAILAYGGPVGVDAAATPVVAGRAYTSTVYLSRPLAAGSTTVQVSVGWRWYGVNGSLLSTSLGAAVTVPRQGTWVRGQVTGTAPAGAVWGRYLVQTTTATTAIDTIYVTSLQTEEGSAATAWADPGISYNLWAGYVERWPQTWDYSGTYGLTQITCIDALAALAAQTIQPSLRQQLAAYAPTMMYPLDEPEGSTQWFDATGTKGPVSIVNSAMGPGTITAGTTLEGGGSYGNPGPVVRVVNTTVGVGLDSPASMLVLPTAGPPATGGWTRMIAFRSTAVPSSQSMLWAATGPAFFAGVGSRAGAMMSVLPGGELSVVVANAAGNLYVDDVTPGINLLDGAWHIVMVGVSPSGTQVHYGMDGFYYQSTAGAIDYHPTGATSDVVACTRTLPAGGSIWAFAGDLAYIAEIPRMLTVNEWVDIGHGFADGWNDEYSGPRFLRILGLAGYTGGTAYRAAAARMGALQGAGGDAVSALQAVADSESGQVWCDGGGTMRLDGREWRFMRPTPLYTFGENAAAGEIPYNGDLTADFDPSHIYNQVTVTNVGAGGSANSTSVSASDTASQVAYLPRSLNRAMNLSTDASAAGAAAWLVAAYKDPHPRVSTITVDASANPSVLPTLLGAQFGHRVRVRRRPPAPAAAIDYQQWLEKITWSGDAGGRLQFRAQLSPADTVPWAVAASTHTTLAVGASIGATSITVAPLTGAAANPARAAMAIGTQLIVGYGTAAAETVTVTGIASTAAGYTSVVLTVSALTAAHGVGELLVQPSVFNLTLPSLLDLDPAATLSATGPRISY